MKKETRVRRSRTGSPTALAAGDKLRTRINLVYRDVSELKAYDYNPRDNEPAIESVANSIKTFGFIIPVVVDADDVLVAGHTRVEAAKRLGMSEVPTVSATHLSEEELVAFRIIDNKVAELAKWDFDLLAGEIQKLQGSSLTLTDFGYSREELDCLTDVVAADCLNTDSLVDLQAAERMRRTERRAPATARFVLGEHVFFTQATEYTQWINGLRVLCDYDEQAITREIKRRLGLAPTND